MAAHQNIYNLKYEEEFIVVVVHDLSRVVFELYVDLM